MSTFNRIDVTCEECGEEFEGVVWTAVHAAQDPELKDLLLGGELNLLMCPNCSHVAYQDHFVLYQDPDAELVAYIYPPSQKDDEKFLRKTMLDNFQEAQAVYPPKERKDYLPVLVFGLESFVEMMREEEDREELSQIAEAVCRENKIPYFSLRPSEARSLKTLRIIPGRKGDPGSIQDALEGIVKANPALESYASEVRQFLTHPKP